MNKIKRKKKMKSENQSEKKRWNKDGNELKKVSELWTLCKYLLNEK